MRIYNNYNSFEKYKYNQSKGKCNFKGYKNLLKKSSFEVSGKNTKAKIFAKEINGCAINQVKELCNLPIFKDSKIRIMPDVSANKDCVVGFSAIVPKQKIKDIPPNIIGNDIGCGVLLIKTDTKLNDLDLKKLDNFIKYELFANKKIRPEMDTNLKKNIEESCKLYNKDKDVIYDQYCTLGGGNHFIEVDADENQNVFLAIHTGSRQYGAYIKSYYENLIGLKRTNNPDITYSDAVSMAQKFAKNNRKCIADIILNKFKLKPVSQFDCPHNYISSNGIVHKGSIDASKGKEVIIPLNMRDGIIIGKGKGNEDWNFSAPHGAGRKLSRYEARQNIDVEDYKKSMDGIYSSVVGRRTIDEAPQAYKDTNETLDIIGDTVDIETIVHPIYNYKKA